ncbi:hypothetical protein [Trinickia dinghuensis]|uniref:hypothetical protein n=1 Tax=Trinickia dinghuensis TaxID=2291023 RepID=UPI0011C0342E|nr:hypothetical protein [Trinickia dinghuensis]
MSSLPSGFFIQAENGTYLSNDLASVLGNDSAQTMKLISQKKDLFKFINTGVGGKYVASLGLDVYLRWDQVKTWKGPSIAIRPSSMKLSSAWTNVPQDERQHFMFRYVTVDNDRVFQLQPGDKHSGNSEYIRRVNWGQHDYVVAQTEDDVFTHFIKA